MHARWILGYAVQTSGEVSGSAKRCGTVRTSSVEYVQVVETRMRQYVWAAAALIASATAATAADFPRGTASYSALSTYSWMGPYIGANVGYQWGAIGNNPARPSGITGGAQAGYNWQFGQFVFGGETDLQFSGANDTFAPWKFSNP